jgi:hypothetical protein
MKLVPYILCATFLMVISLVDQAKADTTPTKQPTFNLSPGDRAYQDVSPEYIEIKVNKVEIKEEQGMFHSGQSLIKIQTDITQVYRTATGLKPGQPLQIIFQRKNSIGYGDIQPTIPSEGSYTVAFLRKDGDTYVPAAQQYTFVPLTPAQMAKINPRKSIPTAKTVTTDTTATITTSDTNAATEAKPITPVSDSNIQLRTDDSSQSKPATDGTDSLPTK